MESMRLSLLLSLLLSACIGPPPSGPQETPDAGADTDILADTRSDLADDAGRDMEGNVDLSDRCNDGTRNGDETDVDCGGGCQGCDAGGKCDTRADCHLGLCVESVCARLESCHAIQKAGLGDGDGEYPVDADGDGPRAPVLAYCDMTLDGEVGYTMVRIDDASLADDQSAYRAACDEIGMEVIVPRTRGHALSILQFNGEPPNLVGVYPRDGASTTAGLRNWIGRCRGEPCRFYLNDHTTNDSKCGEGEEPSGDSDPDGGLFLVGPPSDGCPIGSFNDRGLHVQEQGYVLCSTNDAGPPVYGSCLEVLGANALQNTRLYGPNGYYDLQPEGASAPVEAYCDFIRDGGGYSYVKVEEATELTTAQVEAYCDGMGMQLLVPRSPAHLNNAFFLGVDPLIEPSGSDDYLTLLGVYPQGNGSACSMTAMNSSNASCDMVASDGGPFFVHDMAKFDEPDGSNSRANESLVYDWTNLGDSMKELSAINEPAEPAVTRRFICHIGNKLP